MSVIAWFRTTQPRPAFAIAITSRFRTCMENPKLHQSGRSPVFRRPTSKTSSLSSLNEHLIAQKEKPASSQTHVRDGKTALEQVVRIDVHEDRLAVRLKSADDEEHLTRPTTIYSRYRGGSRHPGNRGKFLSRRAFLKVKSAQRGSNVARAFVSAIARGRRWLDEIVSGSVTDVQQIASRQKCSVRQVNMTISLAFLAPDSWCGPRSKAGCHAASESNGCAMLPQNGASSSKRFGLNPHNYGRARRPFFGLQDSENFRQPTGMAVKTLPRGTEFLDTETGG